MKIIALVISLISLAFSGFTLTNDLYRDRVKMSIKMIEKFSESVIKQLDKAINDNSLEDTVSDSYIVMKSMIKLYIYTDSKIASWKFIDKYVYPDIIQVNEHMSILITAIEKSNYIKYHNMEDTVKRYKKVINKYKTKHEEENG